MMINSQYRHMLLLLAFLFGIVGMTTARITFTAKFPFVARQKKYTPLLYFKQGRTDDKHRRMEKAIAQVEKELGVHVERIHVSNKTETMEQHMLMALTRHPTPFLFHRESCQSIYPTPDIEIEGIDYISDFWNHSILTKRVRAWAKGRILSPQSQHPKPDDPVVAIVKLAPHAQQNPKKEKVDGTKKETVDGPKKEDIDEPKKKIVDGPKKEDIDEPKEEDVGEPKKEDVDEPKEEDVDEPKEEDVDEPTKEDFGEPKEEDGAEPREEE